MEVTFLTQGIKEYERVTDLFYRSRIKEEFDDGEECLVTLKDRSVEPTDDELEWYEMAFGEKRNIMKIKMRYIPGATLNQERQALNAKKYDFWVNFKYEMFPEMEEEGFDKTKYVGRQILLEEEYADEGDGIEYVAEFDYPYGTYTTELCYSNANEEDAELKPLKFEENAELGYFRASHTPVPVSEQQ